MESPTFAGVLAAADAIADALPPTPAWSYPLLDRHVGSSVVVKHENAQPTGAFKVRGGLALAANLDPAIETLVTASTGNHAQSIAYAAARTGRRCIVVMPTSAPSNKVEAVKALGAEVVTHGPTMTEASNRAAEVAADLEGMYVAPDANDVVHGHATVTLELLRSYPDLEAIYVPIGSGTSAAGACLVRDGLGIDCRVIGVQSAQAPAAFRAWTAGVPATAPCETTASGLATGASFDKTQAIMGDRLDDFLLVEDTDLDEARRVLARTAHTLAEGAGAAGLAGALVDPRRPGRIGVIVSGGNADANELASLG